MTNPQWQIPDSRGGDNLIPVTWRVPLAFLAALKENASEQTKATGTTLHPFGPYERTSCIHCGAPYSAPWTCPGDIPVPAPQFEPEPDGMEMEDIHFGLWEEQRLAELADTDGRAA